jgi:membrane-bound metal-dependent hydrolase YbcI (DUF457 family)
MPLPVAHALFGASVVAALDRPWDPKRTYVPLLMGAFLANAADFDFLLVFVLHSDEWHRGFSHSIVFSLLVFLLFAAFLGRGQFQKALAYGLAYGSHALLDFASTKGGGGLELLWPFSRERFMLGRFALSENPSLLNPVEILQAVTLEFALFAPLLLAIVLLRKKLIGRTQPALEPND